MALGFFSRRPLSFWGSQEFYDCGGSDGNTNFLLRGDSQGMAMAWLAFIDFEFSGVLGVLLMVGVYLCFTRSTTLVGVEKSCRKVELSVPSNW